MLTDIGGIKVKEKTIKMMKNGTSMNMFSLILAIGCPFLVFLVPQNNVLSNLTGLHHLEVVLYLTIIILFMGMFSFKEATNWKSMTRSVFTIVITLTMIFYLCFVLFIGEIMER